MQKISLYKSMARDKHLSVFGFFIICAWLIIGFWVTASAENRPGPSIQSDLKDLHATADKVIFDSAEHYAEMFGNVKVTQGQTVITSNTLKIHYYKKHQTKPNQLPGDDTVEKIAAKGNVRIELDSGIALSDEAVYHTKTKELILTGNAKLIRGENTISGSKITINRENGRVTVESSDKKPVEALIFSNEKL